MFESDKEKQQEKEKRIKPTGEKKNFTLCLIRPKAHPTETYGGMEIQHHALFLAAIYGDEWSASSPNTLALLKQPLTLTGW